MITLRLEEQIRLGEERKDVPSSERPLHKRAFVSGGSILIGIGRMPV